MSEHLTPEREIEIRERVTSEYLTAGPWSLAHEQCDCSDGYCSHGEYVTAVITPEPTPIAAERVARTGEAPRDYDFHRSDIGDFTDADWELMAHAREDVPDLLAEIDRLRDELAGLRQGSERWAARCDHIAKQGLRWKAEADGRKAHGQKLEAEREKLRAQVSELEQQIEGLDDLRLRAIDKGDHLRAQLAKVERDNPAAAFTHDCGIPLTRRLDCGHCPHEICQDCDRCPHSCRCGSTGGA